MLSRAALEVLREYIKKYYPEDWLFAGESNDKHITERSVQRIFEKARDKAGIIKDATVHTPRHESSKTTEIYTHVTEKGIRNIRSPLDTQVINTTQRRI